MCLCSQNILAAKTHIFSLKLFHLRIAPSLIVSSMIELITTDSGTALSEDSWIAISPDFESGRVFLTINVTHNTISQGRKGMIKIRSSDYNHEARIQIVQSSKD